MIGNLLHDFSGPSSVDVAGALRGSNYDDTWVEIGLGGSNTWEDDKIVYAELAYRKSLNSGSSSATGFTAGFRMLW